MGSHPDPTTTFAPGSIIVHMNRGAEPDALVATPNGFKTKLTILATVTALTVGIHYGWLIEPFFGHVHWIHVIHGRFCYIPIVIAAAWFGMRGGLLAAGVISLLVLPYILGSDLPTTTLVTEYVEIVFYFAIGGLIGFLVDREFTARRKQQDAQLQVERTQKLSLVGQIAAGVAHEIKNPLASIKGAADILTDRTTTEADREEFNGILRSEVKRIDATVSEFLEFARPKKTELRQLNYTETVRAGLRQIENQAKRSDITLQTNLTDHIQVDGDSEKLHQLLLNLVLNAIQASPAGATITVSLDRTDTGHARLRVKDEGEGIPEKVQPHLFEPFFTTKASGTGLGLAVVKAIVDDHRGEIAIDSRPGAGTEVRVTLPPAGERR